jgi:transcriptional regulator with XRE-family HTH domain
MRIAVDSDCRILSYFDLIGTLVARRKALGMSQELLADCAGLADGYIAKLETPEHPKSGRGLGRVSLELILRSLNLAIVVVDDGGRPLPRASVPGAALAELGLRGLADGTHPRRTWPSDRLKVQKHSHALPGTGRMHQPLLAFMSSGAMTVTSTGRL